MSRQWTPSALGEPPPRVVVLVSAALLLGAAVFAMRTGWPLRYADEQQYVEIAQSVAGGHGYQIKALPTAYRPPAWPVLLVPLMFFGAPSAWLLLLPAALLGVAAVLAGRIASRISGSPWGWIAGPMTVVYPLNLYTASTLYPQILATVLLLAIWAVVVDASDGPGSAPELSPARAGLIGLLAAALTLAVPTMIFSGVVVGAWILWSQRAHRIRTAVLMAAGLALPILAWAVRNLVLLGSPVPFSTSSGQNLLIGNNPTATPDSGLDVDITAWIRGASGLSEPERDRYYRQAALDWVLQHPWDAFVLWLGKTLNYFNPYNAPSTDGQGSAIAMALGWASFGLLVAAVVVRLLIRRSVPLWRSEWLYLWLFVLNAPVMAVFFTRTRFRQPMDACLIVVAAVPLAIAVASALRRSSSRRSTAGAGVE